MRYSVSEIEDQILATLRADTTNFSDLNVLDTFAGQVNPQMFFNPEYMQGFVKLLPFVLVSYQGRTSSKDEWSSSGRERIHTIRFRIFTGARSLRTSKEASRGCYDYLSALYDDLQSKVPKTSPQQLSTYTALSGTALTTSGAVLQGPLTSNDASDEALIINLPGIVVYQSDYTVKMSA